MPPVPRKGLFGISIDVAGAAGAVGTGSAGAATGVAEVDAG